MEQYCLNEYPAMIENHIKRYDFLQEERKGYKIIKNESVVNKNLDEICVIASAVQERDCEEKYKYQKNRNVQEVYDYLYHVADTQGVYYFLEMLMSLSEKTGQIFERTMDYLHTRTDEFISKLEKIDIRVLNHILNITCPISRVEFNENMHMIHKYLEESE